MRFLLLDAGRELDRLDRDYDFVFSNACLQWVPHHEALLPALLGLLRPGGVLAVQVPMNREAPLFRMIAEVVESGRWHFGPLGQEANGTLPPEQYFDVLSGISNDFSIWETTYYHRMATHQGLIDWVKGTWLRPYLAALPAGQRPAFEAELLERAKGLYPMQENGEVLFPFRRFFFSVVAP